MFSVDTGLYDGYGCEHERRAGTLHRPERCARLGRALALFGGIGDVAPSQGRNPLGGPVSALYRVQSSTLANNLRVLARLYCWVRESAGCDLDNRLTRGQALRNQEIESLVSTLRARGDGQTLDTGAFDHAPRSYRRFPEVVAR
jgi:hypothetical protein